MNGSKFAYFETNPAYPNFIHGVPSKRKAMSIRSHLTVKDYLPAGSFPSDPAVGGATGGRSATVAANRFSRILALCREAQKVQGGSADRVWTISDYLASPIRALVFSQEAPESGSATASSASEDRAPRVAKSQPGDETVEKSGEAVAASDLSPGKARSGKSGDGHEPSVLSERQKIDRNVQIAASRYGLPARLINGVIRAESDFRSDAVSPAGACGLMQLMPGTARELGVADPFDVAENIDGGARYLRKMMDLFDGNVRKALMAYNAGPGTVKRYSGDVPYRETRQYVERVMKFSQWDENLS